MQLWCCHSRQRQLIQFRVPTTGLSRCLQRLHPLPSRPPFHQIQSAIHQPRPSNKPQFHLLVSLQLLPVLLSVFAMLVRTEERVLYQEITANVKRISRGMIAVSMLVSGHLIWRIFHLIFLNSVLLNMYFTTVEVQGFYETVIYCHILFLLYFLFCSLTCFEATKAFFTCNFTLFPYRLTI